ncbi:MAG: peptidoglycan DD-metalloendopeptidase family protein [Pseudomonadota bacterium]
MKIILVRDKGSNLSLHLPRSVMALAAAVALVAVTTVGWTVYQSSADQVSAQVVAEWRDKLATQKALVVELTKKNQAQSAAVGRQLAQMQARLLRMEALGAHMSEAAKLQAEEFDFNRAPAQGGPVSGTQATLGWGELTGELETLSAQLRRREAELNILDEVLVHEDIRQASTVKGRPVTWGWLSSPYGKRVDPFTGKTAWHSGVDFAGREGSDVIAVASGVVTYAGERSGYGQLIEITHRNGLVTRYAHHKSALVAVGDVVKKGEPIGVMGSTGRSTGPHVHFEVLKHGRHVDPAGYVNKRS